MLSTLLLHGFVSTILASAILSSSLDGYLDRAFDDKGELSMNAFETFTPDTTGSIDSSVGLAEDKHTKHDSLNPTAEEPCPRLHCLCSKIQQYYTLIQIHEAYPYDAAADLDRQICGSYQIYCCSAYDPQDVPVITHLIEFSLFKTRTSNGCKMKFAQQAAGDCRKYIAKLWELFQIRRRLIY